MSRQALEEKDVDSGEEEEEELSESEKEKLKEKEEERKKELEEKGIQYNIYNIWVWNDEDNMKINDFCREIEKNLNVEIKCLDKSFQLKGHSFEQLNKARNKLIQVINAMTSTAKQVLVTSVRSKKVIESVKLDKAPILDDNEKIEPMVTEEDLKGLKGVFKFRTRNMDDVLGRKTLTCDYWKDICSACKVSGNLDKGLKRLEITTGRRKDVTKALSLLRQLEDIYYRGQFNKKRIPIVHFPNQNNLFNLYFRPRPVKKFDSEGSKNDKDKNIYIIDYTIPKKSDSNSQNLTDLSMKLRNFNFNKMKEFKEGLEHARVHKGEVRFYGSLGESWFSNLDYDTGKSLWKYTDLDNLISQNRVKSGFNEIATHNFDLAVKGLTKVLGSTPENTTEYFEIRAEARNLPQDEFTEVYMYVNVGHVSLSKVTLQWEPLVNVDWTILDREFDFSTVLATRHVIRHDVKPFITFKKKLSVSPGHEAISCEDVEIEVKSKNKDEIEIIPFLCVKSITFKQVSKFKLHDSFVAELACVEDVPLERTDNKVIGKTGHGKAHFTVEIYDENHRKKFNQNAYLGDGGNEKPSKSDKDKKPKIEKPSDWIANWTVDDILGEEPELKNMVGLVKTMLLLVERCHNVTKKLEEQKS